MSQHAGDDSGPEVVLVIEQTRATTFTGDGKGVGRLDGDFEIERQRNRQAVETGS